MVYSLHIKQKTLHTSLLERPNPLSSSSHRAKKKTALALIRDTMLDHLFNKASETYT